jgi:hypothetical protein
VSRRFLPIFLLNVVLPGSGFLYRGQVVVAGLDLLLAALLTLRLAFGSPDQPPFTGPLLAGVLVASRLLFSASAGLLAAGPRCSFCGADPRRCGPLHTPARGVRVCQGCARACLQALVQPNGQAVCWNCGKPYPDSGPLVVVCDFILICGRCLEDSQALLEQQRPAAPSPDGIRLPAGQPPTAGIRKAGD